MHTYYLYCNKQTGYNAFYRLNPDGNGSLTSEFPDYDLMIEALRKDVLLVDSPMLIGAVPERDNWGNFNPHLLKPLEDTDVQKIREELGLK